MIRASVIVFPGSNCDRDVKVALEKVTGSPVTMVWHGDDRGAPLRRDRAARRLLLRGLSPLRAMAAHSPIMRDVIAKAKAGTPVLGICNGFQILCEAGLLPGILMRNRSLRFICRDVHLKVENVDTFFTRCYRPGEIIRVPIAHAEGNYFADSATLAALEGERRVVFRYVDADGNATDEANPNGAINNIAGICDDSRRVLGLMPHPERLFERALGGTDGRRVFERPRQRAVGGVSRQQRATLPIHQRPRSMSDKRLDGRLALVTGASRGLGRAIARALAREGRTSSSRRARRARWRSSTTRSARSAERLRSCSSTCGAASASTSSAPRCSSAGASSTS